MGHNEYMQKVLSLQREGFDFATAKHGYKSQTVMERRKKKSRMRCVITLWDDDSVTHVCVKVPEASIRKGF